MKVAGLLRGSVLIGLAVFLTVCCGKDTSDPGADPYKNLARFRWTSRNYVTDGAQTVEVTTTYKFNVDRTYSMSVKGAVDGVEIESYKRAEDGTYELVGETMAVTPSEGNPYSLEWEILDGSGNLQLVYPDGEVLEFLYSVPQGYA